MARKYRRVDTEGLHAAVDSTRKAEHLSRRQAARQIGVSASTLTRLSQGHRPGMNNLVKLAHWLGWAVEDVVSVHGEPRSMHRPEQDFLTVVRRLLRKPAELDREKAAALLSIIETAYEQLMTLPGARSRPRNRR